MTYRSKMTTERLYIEVVYSTPPQPEGTMRRRTVASLTLSSSLQNATEENDAATDAQ